MRTATLSLLLLSTVACSPAQFAVVGAGGLGAVVLGGLVMATSGEHGELPRAGTPANPAPPEKPAALDETEAVGMAVGQLAFDGIDGHAMLPTLLSVDDNQSRLQVEGRHATLRNLRVRRALDESWRAVGACYEYDYEWQLTSLGTIPECMR